MTGRLRTSRIPDERSAELPGPGSDLQALRAAARDLKILVEGLMPDVATLTPERCRQILVLVDAFEAELDGADGREE